MPTTMFRPWLVQRIEVPRQRVSPGTEPLVDFYTRPKTEELVKRYEDSIKALNALIPCDYMGSAEFEFGEVGKCLRAMSQDRASFTRFEIKVIGHPYAMFPDEEAVAQTKTRKATLLGWCYPEHVTELQQFIRQQVTARAGEWRGKERTEMQDGCFGMVRKDNRGKALKCCTSRICGWLGLDDLWFVSRDIGQAEHLAYLLGIKI